MPAVPGVRTGPGATALLVTPLAPYSAAHAWVSNCSAAFDDPYSAAPAMPRYATIVVTLTMRPQPRSAIAGASAPARKKGARTFVAYIWWNASGVVPAV